jgi:hypothetical protein
MIQTIDIRFKKEDEYICSTTGFVVIKSPTSIILTDMNAEHYEINIEELEKLIKKKGSGAKKIIFKKIAHIHFKREGIKKKSGMFDVVFEKQNN